mmetsp:Transcript_17762/g.26905  ORF Transcript_17762/g.26905 Transcript_17762/m.26905 type:complete len:318 (-) Transcript_17762:3-956(-)
MSNNRKESIAKAKRLEKARYEARIMSVVHDLIGEEFIEDAQALLDEEGDDSSNNIMTVDSSIDHSWGRDVIKEAITLFEDDDENYQYAEGISDSHLARLPLDVIEHISSFNDLKNILDFTSTCKYFRPCANRLVPMDLKRRYINKEHDLFEVLAWLANSGKAAYSRAVPWFLRAGVDVNERVYWVKSYSFNGGGNTPLSLAARVGCKETVAALLSQKADINKASNIDGLTPLHHAAMNGHEDLVTLLINSGCNIEVKCKSGFTPLFSAAAKGRMDTVRQLTELGADSSMETRVIACFVTRSILEARGLAQNLKRSSI